MNKNQIITTFFVFVSILLLLPILSFPLSPDLSCFVMGGKTILSGGSLYVDYIDLKSPIVYYFFAGVVGVFGDAPFNIRLFDFVWQLSTAISIFYFARKLNNTNSARMAGLLYCGIYAMMDWPNLFECETIIALPLVWSIGLFACERSMLKRYIVPAFLLSFVIAFKYTLGLISFPFIYVTLFDRDKAIGRRIQEATVFALVLLCGFAVFHFPLLDGNIRSGYMELVGFLGCYGSYPQSGWFNLDFLIKILFTPNGRMVSVGIGLLFVLSAAIVIRKKKEKPERELMTILISIYVLNLITIIFEKKGFPYHFLRNLVPLVLIVPIGFEYSLGRLRQWRNGRKPLATAFCGIAIALAIAGPLVPISRNLVILQTKITDSEKYFEAITGLNPDKHDWLSFRKIMEVIDSTTGPHSKVINLSINELPLVIQGGYERTSSFAHSYIYEGGCFNASYLAKAAQDYKRADWIVARDNDNLLMVTGKPLSTYGTIVADPELAAILDSCFAIYTEIEGCKLLINREKLHSLR